MGPVHIVFGSLTEAVDEAYVMVDFPSVGVSSQTTFLRGKKNLIVYTTKSVIEVTNTLFCHHEVNHAIIMSVHRLCGMSDMFHLESSQVISKFC